VKNMQLRDSTRETLKTSEKMGSHSGVPKIKAQNSFGGSAQLLPGGGRKWPKREPK